MDICRLCLQCGGQNLSNSVEILKILKNFFPYVNSCLKYKDLQLCDICLTNLNTVIYFNKTLSTTNEKIKTYIEKSKMTVIALINLLEIKNGIGKNCSICRICLKIVQTPQAFLYDNETNIMRHDLIMSMFKYCNFILNCGISENPVMCLKCWEDLQICYSFKKYYLEVDKKINKYLQLFQISKNDLTDTILDEMSKFITESVHGVIMDLDCIEKPDISSDDTEKNSKYGLRKKIKKKYSNGLPSFRSMKETEKKIKIKREYSDTHCHKRVRHYFTPEEDEFLEKCYVDVINVEADPGAKPWRQIQSKWMKKFPSKSLKIDALQRRLKVILHKKSSTSKSKTPLQSSLKIDSPQRRLQIILQEELSTSQSKTPLQKSAVRKAFIDNRVVNIFGTPSLNDPLSDSDDSFVDGVNPVSFTPHVEADPLSDDEMYVIEAFRDCPPSDIDSDTESLPIPQLERMDLPLFDKNLTEYSSVEEKRETLKTIHNEEVHSNVDITYYKTFQRVTTKTENRIETIYNCMNCSFQTKYQYSADQHSNWHANPNKKTISCKYCPFVTSKYLLLNHHLANMHNEYEGNENDDIPVLVPFTIE